MRKSDPVDKQRQAYADHVALDKVAIPLIPSLGIDGAYRRALLELGVLNGSKVGGRRKRQGELFAG